MYQDGLIPRYGASEYDLLDDYPYASTLMQIDPQAPEIAHFYSLAGRREGSRIQFYPQLAPEQYVLSQPLQFCHQDTCRTLDIQPRVEKGILPDYVVNLSDFDIYPKRGDSIQELIFNTSSLQNPYRVNTGPRNFTVIY